MNFVIYQFLTRTPDYIDSKHAQNIILKNQNPKNCKNGQKRPSRAEICENQKKALTFSYFYPREAVYQVSENLAHQTWRKCVADKRTDKRTDGTEIIGPSGKISETNEAIFRWRNFIEDLGNEDSIELIKLFLFRVQLANHLAT